MNNNYKNRILEDRIKEFSKFINNRILILSFSSCRSPQYYYNTGKHQTEQLNSYDAIRNLSRAIKMNPANMDAYNQLAIAYGQVDSILPQIACYDTLLDHKSSQQDRGQLFLLKGNALFLWSQDKQACVCWNKAKDLNVQAAWDKIRINCK